MGKRKGDSAGLLRMLGVPAPKPRRETREKVKRQLEHRLKHDDWMIGGVERGGVEVVRIRDPLRIDKLLAAGVIDEAQHFYGLQVTVLWMVANRSFIGAMNYGTLPRRMSALAEGMSLNRMTAADQFYKTMALLRKRAHKLISLICFDEVGAIEAARRAGIKRDDATWHVREAFDNLGWALPEVRQVKRSLERQEQSE